MSIYVHIFVYTLAFIVGVLFSRFAPAKVSNDAFLVALVMAGWISLVWTALRSIKKRQQ